MAIIRSKKYTRNLTIIIIIIIIIVIIKARIALDLFVKLLMIVCPQNTY
jgi:hypothetical protein